VIAETRLCRALAAARLRRRVGKLLDRRGPLVPLEKRTESGEIAPRAGGDLLHVPGNREGVQSAPDTK
jgi:hypothetical protein